MIHIRGEINLLPFLNGTFLASLDGALFLNVVFSRVIFWVKFMWDIWPARFIIFSASFTQLPTRNGWPKVKGYLVRNLVSMMINSNTESFIIVSVFGEIRSGKP